MNWVRVDSSSELAPPPTITEQQYDDSALGGVAANVKLLLKLIQDHKDACDKEKNDQRRKLRVATMMTILDNVRDRIQKSQFFGSKSSEAELRRCNTNPAPRDKRQSGEVDEEKERLRRELAAASAARKSLQVVCSSLGKEREIMAAELSRKVQELSGMEELVNDLKAQNETLLEKVQECALVHKEKKSGSNVGEALQERNKVLSEQLLRVLEGYRSMKRKLKLAQEENALTCGTMDEMGSKIVSCLERVRGFKDRISLSLGSETDGDAREEIVALESMFEGFRLMIAKHDKKQGECSEHKGQTSASKASVVA